MKSAAVASALLGTAAAGVHKASLQKVPLDKQFEHANINEHVQALGQKYLGAYHRQAGANSDKSVVVPVENFLNAQCPFAAVTLDPTRPLT